MPVLFNSITQFIEQVDRRREHKSNPTQLDSLDCVFVGPAAIASNVCPADLAVHPMFTGMRCIGWTVVDKVALTAEVHAIYTGKLLAGSGPFTTPPLITTSRHLGSISWTTSANATSPTITVGQQTITSKTLVVTSYTARFTLKSATFKYLTNRAPSPDFKGRFVSEANPYLGMENFVKFTTACAYSGGTIAPTDGVWGGTLDQTLLFENDLTDLQVNDLGNGWFEVSEVYMTQALLDSQLI
jgi:hypothetical protein